MTEQLDPVLAESEIHDAEPGTLPGDAVGADEPVSDGRSFAERFRGTAWGEPEPQGAAAGEAPPGAAGTLGADEAPTAAAAPRMRSRRLAGVGVALLGGSILALALLVLGGSNGTLSGAAPTDGLPRMTPGTPAPAAAAAAIDRFLALIADPDLAYEVRMRGSVALGGADIETRFSARVAGSDVDIRYVIERPDAAVAETHVIAVGSRTWMQAGNEKKWRKSRTRPVDFPELDVLDGLTEAAQLDHVGIELRRGSRTDHLRTVDGWVSPLASRLLAGFPGATVAESRLDIWVLPDGRPLEVIATLRASIPAQLGMVDVTGRSSYVLARVGETAAVKPPK